MKKNVVLKLMYLLVVSAIVISSGVIMPFIPEEFIDPPYVVSPDDIYLPEKGQR